MDNTPSLADIGALVGNRNGDMCGGGFWIFALIILFAMMGGGFGNLGRSDYGQFATAASQQEILFGQQFAQLADRIANIANGISDSTYALNNAILNEGRNLSQQIADCCCEQRLATANLSAQMDRQTCEIVNAIRDEGNSTRALMQANEIQALRDKVNGLEMDSRMYGIVRYPNGYTYSAGNSPFCVGGCC